jgi:hypothetical protein
MLSFTLRPEELAGVSPSKENTLEVSIS